MSAPVIPPFSGNTDLSFAYYSSEGNQVTPNFKAQIQAAPSAIYDAMLGCFHNFQVDLVKGYKVYVKGNNQNPFTVGQLTVKKEFADRRNPIVSQVITYQQLNAAGAQGVEVFDFRDNIDAKVIFKIVIDTNFDDPI